MRNPLIVTLIDQQLMSLSEQEDGFESMELANETTDEYVQFWIEGPGVERHYVAVQTGGPFVSRATVNRAAWDLNEALSVLNELHSTGTVELDPEDDPVDVVHRKATDALKTLLRMSTS